MKKTLFVLAVCLLSGLAAQAQDWTFGVKGGLNFAKVTDVDDAKMKFSFHAGAFAEYRFNDFFGIQPEFVYSRQGYYWKGDGNKFWARFNYIDIPVLAKLYVLDNLSVNVGPQFGLLLNSKGKWKEGSTKTTDNIRGSKGLEVSFAMGLTYQVDYNWSVYARYNLGLTEVNKHFDGKNSVIQFGVGYRF